MCGGINNFQQIPILSVQALPIWRDQPAASPFLSHDKVGSIFMLEQTSGLLTCFPKDCVNCCFLRLISDEDGRGLQLAEMWEPASFWCAR